MGILKELVGIVTGTTHFNIKIGMLIHGALIYLVVQMSELSWAGPLFYNDIRVASGRNFCGIDVRSSCEWAGLVYFEKSLANLGIII